MCNKGKEKVNEESVANLKTGENLNNENKRKAIVLGESHIETQNSKTPKKDVAEEESTDSSKEISPFLLFGFIVDLRKGIQKAYSCKFCSRKFTSPHALGGHQNSHKLERSVKEKIQAFNKAWINYSNDNQGISLNNIPPFHMGCGYQYHGYNNMIQHAGPSNFYAENLYGALQHISEIDEVNEGDAGSDEFDQEDKETQEEDASKIDLTLKL
ncbi:putative transcription factor C2H2 family [Medicago truncatula]|uniref:Putative transcription factor C2H2 family n=1 Tax=Medicago truncatula TaxID=3880 RepID=A0A072TXU5_MEDTR|nr:zinc finger protein GIS [Medicago truncatula]KEH21996.1 zinc finger protein [Medicago truncatula]RHN44963.1 putative transcription factor C2H2 family [Medicago truncatula]